MKNKSILLFFSVLAASLTGCMHVSSIPYAISEPECKVGRVDGMHDFAGIYFTFYNNSEKRVKNVIFTCIVFDSDGEKSPLIGSNIISAKFSQEITSYDVHDIVFSLDPYINIEPVEPYIIDFFYIKKIEYLDGSVWEDPYGSWMQGSL